MIGQVFSMLMNMIRSLFGLVNQIFTPLQGWSAVLSVFTMYTAYRLLLVPFLGSATSELGKKVSVGKKRKVIVKVKKENRDV